MFQPQRGSKRRYHAAVEDRKPNPALDDDNDAQAQHSDPAAITGLARLQLDTDWETILRAANWIGLTTCIEQRTVQSAIMT